MKILDTFASIKIEIDEETVLLSQGDLSIVEIPLSEFNAFVKLLRKLNSGLKYFKNGNGKEETDETKGE